MRDWGAVKSLPAKRFARVRWTDLVTMVSGSPRSLTNRLLGMSSSTVHDPCQRICGLSVLVWLREVSATVTMTRSPTSNR